MNGDGSTAPEEEAPWEEVALTGRLTPTIAKQGKPVAGVSPLEETGPTSLLGSVVAEDDIVSPSGETWRADQ